MNELRNKDGLTEKEFLQRYDPLAYPNPAVTVDMVVFTFQKESRARLEAGLKTELEPEQEPIRKPDLKQDKKLKLLLIRRGDHPCIHQWALPGGFVNIDEDLEKAAQRELQEETNAQNIYLEQLYTFGDVHRDPRNRIITVAYLALIDSSSQKIVGGDDAAEAKWFTVTQELLKEETAYLDCNDRQITKQIKLILQDRNDLLSAVIEVSERTNDEMPLPRKKVTLIDNNGIAFDHGKIIYYGWEKLHEKLSRSDL